MEIYNKTLTEQSYRDMVKFLRFANSISEVPLLFGGWAVYQYLPYAGSKDVDFVVSDENFDKCVDFLVKKEGYTVRAGRLIKGDIFFDLYKKSEDINGLKFEILYDNSERLYLRGTRYEVLLPHRWALFYFKIQALVRRNVRKDASDSVVLILGFAEEDFESFHEKVTNEMRIRLKMLQEDNEALAMVAKPTRKKLRELKDRIRRLTR